MKQKIAVIDGLRSPIGKLDGMFSQIEADRIGASVLKELLIRNYKFELSEISEVIIGNVGSPAHCANIARVIALRSNVPETVPAFSVNRNCASGMESVSSSIVKIIANEGDIYVAGGVESMSNIPFLYNKNAKNFFSKILKSKKIINKIKALSEFRPSYFKPTVALMQGLTDPIINLTMGETAEILVEKFNISREEQDEFALNSHKKAMDSCKKGILSEEIVPIIGNENNIYSFDEGIRDNQSMEALAKLKPAFSKYNGSVTAGNSSQISDGAAFMILMSTQKVKNLKLNPIGYIKDFAYSAIEPEMMGLGPVYAINKIMKRNNLKLKNIDLIEINEAFAGQVLACTKAFDSKDFAINNLKSDDKIGEIDFDKLNVNGGSIALGHPVGMTGSRLIITLLKELKRRNLKTAIASLCIGGGQGAAFLLESN